MSDDALSGCGCIVEVLLVVMYLLAWGVGTAIVIGIAVTALRWTGVL